MSVKLKIKKACNGVVIKKTEDFINEKTETTFVMMNADHAIESIAGMLGINLKIESASWENRLNG